MNTTVELGPILKKELSEVVTVSVLFSISTRGRDRRQGSSTKSHSPGVCMEVLSDPAYSRSDLTYPHTSVLDKYI